jgi:GNAT superfamily N-acetyltransferase
MEVAASRLFDLPADALSPLLAESEREGWRFVRRLADEWAAGTNRFDRPGEVLLSAWVDGVLVGVCGLTVDPYATDPAVGRIRRLYVVRAFRGRGVGQVLLRAVLQFARGRFRLIRVRTESGAAARLHERLGFVPAVGVADCTHTLVLEKAANQRQHQDPKPASTASLRPPGSPGR